MCESLTPKKTKTIRDSATQQVHIVMNGDLNSNGTLYGGHLMCWIDEVAGVVARRHSGTNVCTASVDRLDFLRPAYRGDLISVEGRIVYVGRSSMVVEVLSFVESLSAGKESKARINRAFLTMVALDQDGKPTPVPRILPTTPEEEELLAAVAESRRMIQKGLSE